MSGLIHYFKKNYFHSQRAGDFFFKKENKIFTPIGREILFFWQIKYIFSLPKTERNENPRPKKKSPAHWAVDCPPPVLILETYINEQNFVVVHNNFLV